MMANPDKGLTLYQPDKRSKHLILKYSIAPSINSLIEIPIALWREHNALVRHWLVKG